jgi:hypothetical protein
MIKKILATMVLGLASLAGAQSHVFPATDTNNTFTGTNRFTNTVTLDGAIAGQTLYGTADPALSCAPASIYAGHYFLRTDNGKLFHCDAAISTWVAISGTGTGICNVATTGTVGCVKPDGSTISIDVDGTIHVANASPLWSAILNPNANESLSMAGYSTTFTWGSATGSGDMFTMQDTTGNAGTGIIHHVKAASGSGMTPWQADANGVGWQVAPDGSLRGIGGTTHAIKIPGNSSPPSGVSNTTVLDADAAGNFYANEGNVGHSRVCTAANGVCGSGVGGAYVYLSNSSDVGAQITAASTTLCAANGGVIVLPNSVTIPWTTTGTIGCYGVSLIGYGQNASIAPAASVAGDVLAFTPTFINPTDPLLNGNTFHDFQIVGTGAANQVLFHNRDVIGSTVFNIRLNGTSGSPASVCYEWENVNHWTQENYVYNVYAGTFCTIPYYFNQNIADASRSFGANFFDLHSSPTPTNAFTAVFGGTGSADLYNGIMHISADLNGTNNGEMKFTNSWTASNETIQIDGEQFAGSGGTIFNIGASASVRVQGYVNSGGPSIANPIPNFCTGSCTSANFLFNGMYNTNSIGQQMQLENPGSSFTTAPLQVSAISSSSFAIAANFLDPNLSGGQRVCTNLGVDQSANYGTAAQCFKWVSSGSSSNEWDLFFTNIATPSLYAVGTGKVGTTNNILDDGAGKVTIAGIITNTAMAGTGNRLVCADPSGNLSAPGSCTTGGGTTTNALTMNNNGSGAASGSTFDGSAAKTISYNTIGAAPLASPSFTGTVTLPVTGSTQCLQVNSSGVVGGTGSACGSGSSGPYTRVGQVTVSGSTTTSIAFTSISGAFTNLYLHCAGQSNATLVDNLYIAFNTDTAANRYTYGGTQGGVASSNKTGTLDHAWIGYFPTNTSSSTYMGTSDVTIPNYSSTAFKKVWNASSTASMTGTSTNPLDLRVGGNWESTAAITSLTITPGVGPDFVAGTVCTLDAE